ncbi:MAG: gliding motility-associated C-terminal domain-containing protein [bacterium]|nr:gliding motility-associated C-terminal domain-containing protein [bacterium]
MKSVFKHNKILILVLIYFSANIGLKASHIFGAEITYQIVKANQYKFFLKVYRDCNECKFNSNGGGSNSVNCDEVPNLKISGGLNSGYSSLLDELTLTRVAIRDITPTCYGTTSKCKVGSSLEYGFEVQEFEGEFDFTGLLQQNKCIFDISIAISGRNPAINSSLAEQNFFNFVTLNLCNGVQNESTKFTLNPVLALLQNQTHRISLGISNPDHDSLSFKLQSALLNRNQNITYSVGKSGSRPYSVYCNAGPNCAPNPEALPLAEGFYLSPITGDIVFTPTVLNEAGVIVVECEEWKKDKNGNLFLAGVTRRDIYAEVISATNNLPCIKNKELLINICEGETLNYPIDLEDLKMFGLSSDTVSLEYYSDLNDLSLIKSNKSFAPFNYYRLNLNNTLNKNGKYYITLNARDNNCPLNGQAAKTIVLTILANRQLTYTYKTKNCGLLQVDNKDKNQVVRWTLCDMKNNELYKSIASSFNFQLPAGGSYILKYYLEATDRLCALSKQDVITIPDFYSPVLDLGPAQNVCKGTLVKIDPLKLTTFDNFKILKDNVEVQFPYTYTSANSIRHRFKVIQDNGCFVEVFYAVNVYPSLLHSFITDTICANLNSKFDLDNLIVADRSLISKIEIIKTNVELNIVQKDALNWEGNIAIPRATHCDLKSIITDNQGCVYNDAFNLEIIEPQAINVVVPAQICSNIKSLKLDAAQNSTWTCINYPTNLAGNMLNIQPPYTGIVTLHYEETKNKCTNSRDYNIQIVDTTAIKILNPASILLCENADPVVLNATPANGKWQGNFISQNIFQTYTARNTKNILTYNYTNAVGCKSSASMGIEVVGLPQLTVEADKQQLCVGDELELAANTDALNLIGYWYTDGNGVFNNINNAITNYVPSLTDVNMGLVHFSYTIQTNTICGDLSQGLNVQINKGPTGKIIKDYALSQCEPAVFQFKTDYRNISKQYWYLNDSLVEDFDYETNLDLVLNAGTYVVKTKVVNKDCESVTNSKPIVIYAKPKTNFVSNPGYKLSREYPRLYLKDLTSNRTPYSTQWYFNNQAIDQSREFYYNIAENVFDTFRIKLVSVAYEGSCADSLEKIFVFNPLNQLYIPDAFSPDTKGPDENNEFRVKGPAMQYFYMEIFNKWGEIVYYSKDMNAAWDGNFGGKLASQGVYFYKINSTDMSGVSRDYSGTITLIR